MQKRRGITNDSGQENMDDDMSASLPRSVPAPSNTNSQALWDTTSVMSSSTFGDGNINGGNFGYNNTRGRGNSTNLGDDDGTFASKGVESLLFSGLSNIDENRPLRGMNHFAKVATSSASAAYSTATGNTMLQDGGAPLSNGGHGVGSVRSNARSVRSVFTEKKQEDIDRLFADLLGQPNGNDDTQSNASSVSAMSSVMPIVNAPNARLNGTAFNRAKSRGPGASSASIDPSVQRTVASSHNPYSSNQYIFDEKSKSTMSNRRPRVSDHDLIYGDNDSYDGKGKSNSMMDRFSRFYAARSNRMLHVRAGFILLFLCSLTFIALQVIVVSEHNREQMKILRSEYAIDRAVRPNYISEPLDETQDRPVRVKSYDNSGNVDGTVLKAGAQAANFAKELTTSMRGQINEITDSVDTDLEEKRANTGPTDKLLQPKKPLPVQENKQAYPVSFSNLADLTDGKPPFKDTPFFWQVPRAGGGTLRQILSECKGAVLAAEPGGQGPFAGDTSLEVVQVGKGNYINVDTTFLGGLKRAKQLNLVASKRADVIISPYIFETSDIFSQTSRGRMFAFIRHPIERCASMYAYKKTIDPEIASMSLLDYARSGRVENNWMTRFLSNQLQGEITFDHVVIAKEVLRTKCLIGLKEFLWASIKRYEFFFDWKYDKDPAKQYECRKKKLLEDIDLNEFEQPKVEEGTQEWTMLLWQNKFDMKLYKYAQELFKEQISLFPDGFS